MILSSRTGIAAKQVQKRSKNIFKKGGEKPYFMVYIYYTEKHSNKRVKAMGLITFKSGCMRNQAVEIGITGF